MPNGKCSALNCEKVGRLRRGMCGAHYEKARRNGAYTEVICKMDGCADKGTYRAYCHKHYQQVRLNDPESLPPVTLEDRFWPHVDKSDSCWTWTGAHDGGAPYGRIKDGGKLVRAHRVSFEIHNGPIPEGVVVDHICHNTLCVNPDHLRLGTTQWNAEHRKGANANGTSGYRNVSWHCQTKKWWACLKSNGVQYSLGLHDDPYEAHLAVVAKRRELHHWDAPDNHR